MVVRMGGDVGLSNLLGISGNLGILQKLTYVSILPFDGGVPYLINLVFHLHVLIFILGGAQVQSRG